MLVDEENIVLKACVQMCLKAKLSNHWVVMAVNVGIHPVHSLEYLSDHARERLWELDA